MSKKNTVNLIWKICIYAIVFVLLFVSVKLLIGQIKGKAVFFGDKSFVRIATPSMVNKQDPKNGINVGDFIVIERVDPANVQVGDVISFYSKDPAIFDKINTHRVIEINDDGSFVTKGDNSPNKDAYAVSPDDLIGKMVGKLVVATTIVNLLTKNVFIFALIILILLIFAFTTFFTPSKQSSQEQNDAKINDEIEKIKKQAVEDYIKTHKE